MDSVHHAGPPMLRLSARLARLEALRTVISAADMVGSAMAREPDVSAWLLSPDGDEGEKAAVWAHILKLVDGRSKGPPERKSNS